MRSVDIQYADGPWSTRPRLSSTASVATRTRTSLLATISVSYDCREQDIPLEYAKALFIQLGSRGISVLYPVSNDGVGLGDCDNSSGSVRFVPEFPSSCPHVTVSAILQVMTPSSLRTSPEVAPRYTFRARTTTGRR